MLYRKLLGLPLFLALITGPEFNPRGVAQVRATLPGYNGYGTRCPLAFSPDGRTLATGFSEGGERDAKHRVKLWDAATGKEGSTLEGHKGPISSVAFSPDGKTLAAAGAGGEIKLWDVGTGKERLSLKYGEMIVENVFPASVLCLRFSPDGKKLIASGEAEILKLWDTATGKETGRLSTKGGGHVGAVAFAPDGKTVAAGGSTISGLNLEESLICLWELASGKEFKRLTHGLRVYSVVFSPDGKTLASASYDDTVKFWDLASGAERLVLKGHTSSVNSVAFSADGKILASASSDHTVKLWDHATGKELATLKGHAGAVNSVEFDRDAKTLASTGKDKTILWDVAKTLQGK